ncbi:AFR552Cp, related [Neospora caninum Liverpool]|uniref:AFR552Cp, related n=1 Tax=Neospora caninum (strain Liverpool) TaxID=572307 RepID=F0VQ89_NEOCL|nr:AFR552Cp, related [Neospora caninum Liverpool]CBZ55886.1 AFR552Cp, related [Neospora caninum Liverpool]|eukprot:XP_003885912.1 AFR552Cp, related [Neospora caninum Liverpool]
MSTTNPEIRETEWDALQRKFGNLPKLPDVVTEEQLTREVVDAAEKVDTLASKSLRELDALEDEVEEDVLEKYRRKRLEEIQRKQKLERKAKKSGTWVVVHLYQNAIPACKALNEILPQLAQRHREIKFMKGIATDIIPNYPDSKVPTLLLYFGGTCRAQVVGLQKEWAEEGDATRKLATLQGLERFLAKYGVLNSGDTGCRDESDGDSSEEESRRGARHLRISYGQSGGKSRARDDESDEEKERTRNKGYSSVGFDNKIQRGY